LPFDAHPQFGGLFACLRTASGSTVGPRRAAGSFLCNKQDLWNCGFTPNGFLRRSATEKTGLFNQKLGPGPASKCQSGEDLDYFLRCLETGVRICYEPVFTVYHPSYHSAERLVRVSYPYALGGGYVLRSHRYPFTDVCRRIIVSFGGAVASFLRGNFTLSYIYLVRGLGQLRGYVLGPRDLVKLRD
jgi:hypothetical protein